MLEYHFRLNSEIIVFQTSAYSRESYFIIAEVFFNNSKEGHRVSPVQLRLIIVILLVKKWNKVVAYSVMEKGWEYSSGFSYISKISLFF